jgi:hypothetical protein
MFDGSKMEKRQQISNDDAKLIAPMVSLIGENSKFGIGE